MPFLRACYKPKTRKISYHNSPPSSLEPSLDHTNHNSQGQKLCRFQTLLPTRPLQITPTFPCLSLLKAIPFLPHQGSATTLGIFLSWLLGKVWFRYILWKTAFKAQFPPPPSHRSYLPPCFVKAFMAWAIQTVLIKQLGYSVIFLWPVFSTGPSIFPSRGQATVFPGVQRQAPLCSILKGEDDSGSGKPGSGEGGWHVPSALCIHLLSERGLLHPWFHSVHQARVMLSMLERNEQASGHFTESHTVRIRVQI